MSQEYDNKIVKQGMAIGLLFSLVYILSLYILLPVLETGSDNTSRLALAASCLVLPALTLIAGILVVGLSRFGNEAQDPTKVNANTKTMQINLRYLSNTHEQLTLFILCIFPLAVLLPETELILLPIYSSLFFIGRLFFWAGYHLNILYRAPGFGMSLMTAIIATLYNLFALLELMLS